MVKLWTTNQTAKHIVYNSVRGQLSPLITYKINMKNKLQYIKQTWTYNHKLLIVAIALTVAHAYPLIKWPTVQAEPITYTKPPIITYNLDSEILKRTIELYELNRDIDLERYRLDAIGEINKELQNKVYQSTHVDYENLKATYGY